MRDVLILTSGQEEHHYAARTLRDRIEDLAGTDVRVEIREVGDQSSGGWIARIRGLMGKKKGEAEKLLKWVRRTADGTFGRSRWPQFRRSVALALDEGRREPNDRSLGTAPDVQAAGEHKSRSRSRCPVPGALPEEAVPTRRARGRRSLPSSRTGRLGP